MQMTAGVTKSNEGIEDITWNILGQTYVPKQWSEHSFSWHATLPPGTFVPPHIHPEQDEFIYVLEGKFDLILDGSEAIATPGDLIRLPRGIPHGIFNNSEETNLRRKNRVGLGRDLQLVLILIDQVRLQNSQLYQQNEEILREN